LHFEVDPISEKWREQDANGRKSREHLAYLKLGSSTEKRPARHSEASSRRFFLTGRLFLVLEAAIIAVATFSQGDKPFQAFLTNPILSPKQPHINAMAEFSQSDKPFKAFQVVQGY
jgi:hypothetical protein